MKPPKTINGFPILWHHATPAAHMTRAGFVILVDRGADSYERYVTAWLGAGDSSWCHGRYYDDFDRASDDYWTRVRRGH